MRPPRSVGSGPACAGSSMRWVAPRAKVASPSMLPARGPASRGAGSSGPTSWSRCRRARTGRATRRRRVLSRRPLSRRPGSRRPIAGSGPMGDRSRSGCSSPGASTTPTRSWPRWPRRRWASPLPTGWPRWPKSTRWQGASPPAWSMACAPASCWPRTPPGGASSWIWWGRMTDRS